MALLHFHFHHSLSRKEGIVYSQALRYMIISNDHMLQEELNNLTRILLACASPLHLIIKNIKKVLTHTRNRLLSQRKTHTEKNILPIITPFSNKGKLFAATIHKHWHTIADCFALLTIWPIKLLSAYTKSNTFTTTFSTMHKHMAYLSEILNTAIHIHRYTTI